MVVLKIGHDSQVHNHNFLLDGGGGGGDLTLGLFRNYVLCCILKTIISNWMKNLTNTAPFATVFIYIYMYT
jgi:hypothetical protein